MLANAMARSSLDPLRLIIIVTVTAVVVVRVTYWLEGGRDRSPASQARPSGTGRITGVVVDDLGTPLPDARLALYLRSGPSGDWDLRSDQAGRFTIDDLPAGTFDLHVGKAGYSAGSLPRGPITLEPAERLESIPVRLNRTGSIAGMVYGADGRSVRTGFVRVIPRHGEALHSTLRGIGPDGLYQVTGLAAGDYIVTVNLGAASKSPFYFPGSWRGAEAQTITIAIGEARTGVDVHTRVVPAVDVTGIVTLPDGRPAVAAAVHLLAAQGVPNASPVSTTADARGRFRVTDVPPDRYWIAATAPPLWARAEVAISGKGSAPVRLTLAPGGRVTGRMSFEPAPAAGQLYTLPVATLIGQDERDRGWGPAPRYSALPIAADGTFAIEGVAPGRYTLHVLASTWSVDAVTMPSGAIDAPMDVRAGETIADLSVRAVDELASVEGIARMRDGTPAAAHLVVAFPAEPHVWPVPGFRVGVAELQTNGRFRISSLRSGQYLLAVVPPSAWTGRLDVEFLRPLRSVATPVTLTAGKTVTRDIAIR